MPAPSPPRKSTGPETWINKIILCWQGGGSGGRRNVIWGVSRGQLGGALGWASLAIEIFQLIDAQTHNGAQCTESGPGQGQGNVGFLGAKHGPASANSAGSNWTLSRMES